MQLYIFVISRIQISFWKFLIFLLIWIIIILSTMINDMFVQKLFC